MNLRELGVYIGNVAKEYPKLKEQVWDIFYLAHEEILDGSSEFHECELAYDEIKDLIEEEKNNE